MIAAEERSVLVVDDEAGMRTALRASFLRHGWNVKAANGVRDAVSAVDHGNFDLVVTDVRMRDGDGFDVMRHVREHSPATAVVLLTAFGNVPEAVRSMRGGAVDYLTKPVSFEELHSTSLRALERAVPRRAVPATEQPPAAVGPAPGASIAEVERLHLENTLALANGNRTRAAAMLGISLRTMRNRIREYGLPPRAYTRRSHA